ncbi:hypothetical protein OAG71_04735 [bacterium]|nr:hypothetical protein [bacterium]
MADAMGYMLPPLPRLKTFLKIHCIPSTPHRKRDFPAESRLLSLFKCGG